MMLVHRILPCVVVLFAAATSRDARGDDAGERTIRAFVARHCRECHDSSSAEGGLDLLGLRLDLGHRENFDRWTDVFDRVAEGKMPPASEVQPLPSDRQSFVSVVKQTLRQHSLQRQREFGRVSLRRLNRNEYERTVHDLLDIHAPLKEILPTETPLHGFDTVADGLGLSQLHMEKYLEAADAALDAAIQLGERPDTIKKRFLYKDQEGIRKNIDKDGGKPIVRDLDRAVVLFADASYITKVHGLYIRDAGLYRIRARGWAFQSDKPVVLRLYAGHYGLGTVRMLGFFDMPNDEPREVEITTRLEQGEYLYPAPDDLVVTPDGRGVWHTGALTYEGSGLALEWIEVEGPDLDEWPQRSLSRLFADTPIDELPANRRPWKDGKRFGYVLSPQNAAAAIRPVLEQFAARACRRPLEPGEIDGHVRLSEQALAAGASFEEAMRIGFRGVLASPQFLFLDEQPGKLSDVALASRLSYFLWSTMPDEELLKVAADGRLSQPGVLRAQVERMLADSKSAALTRNFVGQWLNLRGIDDTAPDSRLYPEFDELLKHSMIAETEAFFQELLDRDLSVANFGDSDFVMINRRLAEHYGIPNVAGEQIRRVAVPADVPRGGVLTQASVLKVTANGTVTSPVMRGAWVMTRLLNQPPPAPPPDIGTIEPDTRGATTIREQLAKHRNVATCATCHAHIDPPGFALECFDVIGGYRERYRSKEIGDAVTTTLGGRKIWEYRLGPTVDASGEWIDGSPFEDVRQFKQVLLKDKQQLARSVAAHLLIYATGAGIQFADRDRVDALVKEAEKNNYGLRSLVHAIVQSDVFRSK